ncbi:MAG: MFS transporter [Acidobacteria bacterium]|nr:MAG: MFS transporter [Acidobacteriota bacterium]
MIRQANMAVLKTLTYLMFAMFAMTTDSVGIIIPEIVKTFRLSLTAAGTFQYATMAGIALAGFLLGHLADRYGRKATIIVGLTLFAAASYLFIAGTSFVFFSALMALSGIAIGIFKTGSLALIGDISRSTAEHTSIMNTVEGFFGIGSIVGPAVLSQLLNRGIPWQWLYTIAGSMCVVLILTALNVRYPTRVSAQTEQTDLKSVSAVMKNRFVLLFSVGAFLYVAVEAAIYVWMPTLLAGYNGPGKWIAIYSISIFFLLRAGGRFLGAWMLNKLSWSAVITICSGMILACFAISIAGGVSWGVYSLPLSGLFMSVIYPTINSKGISCVPKSEHGAAAGVILFYTCLSAVLAPLAMGAVSDAMGGPIYGFALATAFAALLFFGLVLNNVFNPAAAVFQRADESDYSPVSTEQVPS